MDSNPSFHFANVHKTCQHSHPIEDTQEGHWVCPDCGLVLDVVYQDALRNSPPTPIKDYDYYRLADICHRVHIHPSVLDTAHQLLLSWRKRLSHCPEACGDALVLYHALLEHSVPRPMVHVCQACQADIKHVWKWQKVAETHGLVTSSSIRPKDMAEYFLRPLCLSYAECQAILNNVEQLPPNSFSPRTILATSSYLYLKEDSSRKEVPSIQHVGDMLNVSVMSMYRCQSFIKHAVSPRSSSHERKRVGRNFLRSVSKSVEAFGKSNHKSCRSCSKK